MKVMSMIRGLFPLSALMLTSLESWIRLLNFYLLRQLTSNAYIDMLPQRLAVPGFTVPSLIKASLWLGAQVVLHLEARHQSEILGEQGPWLPFIKWKNESVLWHLKFNKMIKFNNHNIEVKDLKIDSLQIFILKYLLKKSSHSSRNTNTPF